MRVDNQPSGRQPVSNKTSAWVSPAFQSQARGLSRQYTLDVRDVENAYRSKPESLAAHFSAMNEAKDWRLISMIGAAVSLAVIGPRSVLLGLGLLAIAAVSTLHQHSKIGRIGDTLRDEIKHHNRSKMALQPEL